MHNNILKYSLLTVTLWTITFVGAQTRTYYKTAKGKLTVKPLEKAEFVEVTQTDSGTLVIFHDNVGRKRSEYMYESFSYKTKDNIRNGNFYTYYPDESIKGQGYYANGKRDGLYTQFYKNGTVQLTRHYAADKSSNDLKQYYSNGKLKRIEHFESGQSTGGQCYDSLGVEIAFTPYEVLPSFVGGIQILRIYLEANLHYPTQAAINKIEGKTIVGFVVEKDGSISNVIVKTSSGNAKLDAEAMRVVKNMPHWNPGTQDGIPKKAKFALPIAFHLIN